MYGGSDEDATVIHHCDDSGSISLEVRVTPPTQKARHKDVQLLLQKILVAGKSFILPVFFLSPERGKRCLKASVISMDPL